LDIAGTAFGREEFAALAAKAKASWSQLAMRTISGLGALPTIQL
jgi:hypothetical protein